MGWIYRNCLRSLLFLQESEAAHNRVLKGLSLASKIPMLPMLADGLYGAPNLPVEIAGLRFPNPVGLAAGMDKSAAAVPMWERLGFGFAELGGVTRHAQSGNDAPRMFRAVADRALVNRMGFNNPGADTFARALSEWHARDDWPGHPIGINLGKSKITPLEEAAEDYAFTFCALQELADFFVVNVSSPNTPNLRQLQDKSALAEILAALQEANDDNRPILVKVAPDLGFDALDEILELVEPHNLAGIVATNTTIARPAESGLYAETGGLSGRPLARRSTEVIRHLYRQSGGRVPLIGVGGIFDAADAWEKITAGASLLQIYSGMVYEGPQITRAILKGLAKRLAREGFTELREAGGTEK